MKVRIEAGGREVEIDCADTNTTPHEIAAEVLAIWKATNDAHPATHAGYGFTTSAARPPHDGYADLRKGQPLHITSEEPG